MSHCFHVWYAHPLPWDAESGQEHWEQTRNSGVHEPRLVGCVERLNALLQAHDADMVWAEEPEVSEYQGGGRRQFSTRAPPLFRSKEGRQDRQLFNDTLWRSSFAWNDRRANIAAHAASRTATCCEPVILDMCVARAPLPARARFISVT